MNIPCIIASAGNVNLDDRHGNRPVIPDAEFGQKTPESKADDVSTAEPTSTSTIPTPQKNVHLQNIPQDILDKISEYAFDDFSTLYVVNKDFHQRRLAVLNRLLRMWPLPPELLSLTSTPNDERQLAKIRYMLIQTALKFNSKTSAIVKNVAYLAELRRERLFSLVPSIEQGSPGDRSAVPEWLLNIWQKNQLRSLSIIDVALQLNLITPDALGSFPELMNNALVYSAALNCPTVLKHTIAILRSQMPAHFNTDVSHYYELLHVLRLSILEGAQQSSFAIINSLARIRSPFTYDPYNCEISHLILLALAEGQPQVAYAILTLNASPVDKDHMKADKSDSDKIFEFLKKAALNDYNVLSAIVVDSIKKNQLKLLQYLARKGLLNSIQIRTKYLFEACQHGQTRTFDIFASLPNINTSINTLLFDVDVHRWLPLHYAARVGNVAAISFLLDHYIERSSRHGFTDSHPRILEVSPLHFAVENGHIEAMSMIMEKFPLWLWDITKTGINLLHSAARSKNPDSVKMLVNAMLDQGPLGKSFLKALLHMKDDTDSTPLMCCRDQDECRTWMEHAENMARDCEESYDIIGRKYYLDLMREN